jgi:hypothetical protein
MLDRGKKGGEGNAKVGEQGEKGVGSTRAHTRTPILHVHIDPPRQVGGRERERR